MQSQDQSATGRTRGAVDARRYMPSMDIFALPSQYEGFPYVLLEALHAGLPVISTPVGGALESVVPDVNGIIVPHDKRPTRSIKMLHEIDVVQLKK